MKTLILVRHADSSKDIPDIEDWERPVSEKGIKDSHKVFSAFKAKNIVPHRIITSYAFRALNTAIIMAQSMSYNMENLVVQPKLFDTTGEDIIKMLKEQDDAIESLMLVGHNPSITEAYAILTGIKHEVLPTSSVSVIKFNITNWKAIDKLFVIDREKYFP